MLVEDQFKTVDSLKDGMLLKKKDQSDCTSTCKIVLAYNCKNDN